MEPLIQLVRLLPISDGLPRLFARVGRALRVPTSLFGLPADHDLSNVVQWLSHLWGWHVAHTRAIRTGGDAQGIVLFAEGDVEPTAAEISLLLADMDRKSPFTVHVCSSDPRVGAVMYACSQALLSTLTRYSFVARMMRQRDSAFGWEWLQTDRTFGIRVTFSSYVLKEGRYPVHKRLDPLCNVQAAVVNRWIRPLDLFKEENKLRGPLESRQFETKKWLDSWSHPEDRFLLCERFLDICVAHLTQNRLSWFALFYNYGVELIPLLERSADMPWLRLIWTYWNARRLRGEVNRFGRRRLFSKWRAAADALLVEWVSCAEVSYRLLAQRMCEAQREKTGRKRSQRMCGAHTTSDHKGGQGMCGAHTISDHKGGQGMCGAHTTSDHKGGQRMCGAHTTSDHKGGQNTRGESRGCEQFEESKENKSGAGTEVCSEREMRHWTVCRDICGFGGWLEFVAIWWADGEREAARAALTQLLRCSERVPRTEYQPLLELLAYTTPGHHPRDIGLPWWEKQMAAPYSGKKRVAIWCRDANPASEAWDLESDHTTGIGGSEEAVIYMARALARAGCQTVVYGFPLSFSQNQLPGTNPRLLPSAALVYSETLYDVFISWRDPDLKKLKKHARHLVLWLHDMTSPHAIHGESQCQMIARYAHTVPSFRGVFFLSQHHLHSYFPRLLKEKGCTHKITSAFRKKDPPVLACPPTMHASHLLTQLPSSRCFTELTSFDTIPERVAILTSNGVDRQQFAEEGGRCAHSPSSFWGSSACSALTSFSCEDKGKEGRRPYRCIYASNYRRGLNELLRVWPEVKKRFPLAELDVYFGWPPYDAKDSEMAARLKELQPLGVVEHGRVDHWTLARAMKSAEFWTYPCTFDETFCIVAIKAQAAGLIPVVRRRGALLETVFGGYTCETIDEYLPLLLMALGERASQASLHARWRTDLSKHVLRHYTWDAIAASWIRWFGSLDRFFPAPSTRLSPPMRSYGYRTLSHSTSKSTAL